MGYINCLQSEKQVFHVEAVQFLNLIYCVWLEEAFGLWYISSNDLDKSSFSFEKHLFCHLQLLRV